MGLTLLHFTAAWADATCAPHRRQVRAAADILGAQVVEQDVDVHPATTRTHRVMNVPAVAVAERPDLPTIVGARTAADLVAIVRLLTEDKVSAGDPVTGDVVAHEPWGLEVMLTDNGATASVDAAEIADDPLLRNPDRWPSVGSRVAGRYLGVTPNGQIRVSLRLTAAPGGQR